VGRVAKPDASPVTGADFAAQAVVLRALELEFPAALVCAEEDGDGFALLDAEQRADAARRASSAFPELGHERELARVLDRGGHAGWTGGASPFFVVDPIDGTKGFIRNEQFAVCVGFVDEAGHGAMGCLGCPNVPVSDALRARAGAPLAESGALFVAWAGRGAREMLLFPESAADAALSAALACGGAAGPAVRALESYESSHKVPAMDDVKRAAGVTHTRMLDSQAKFALLARGEADVFPRINRFDQFIWDVLPGAVIALEAGCVVTDLAGAPLRYTLGRTLRTRGVLSARTADLHRRMVRAAAESGVGGADS